MLNNGSLTNVKYPKSIWILENQVDIKTQIQPQPNPSLLPHIKSTWRPPPLNTIVITRTSPILITKHNYVHNLYHQVTYSHQQPTILQTFPYFIQNRSNQDWL